MASIKSLFIWLAGVMLVLAIYQWTHKDQQLAEIDYAEFVADLREDRVERIEVVHGTDHDAFRVERVSEQGVRQRVTVRGRFDDEVQRELHEQGVPIHHVRTNPAGGSAAWMFSAGLLVIAAIGFFISLRRMRRRSGRLDGGASPDPSLAGADAAGTAAANARSHRLKGEPPTLRMAARLGVLVTLLGAGVGFYSAGDGISSGVLRATALLACTALLFGTVAARRANASRWRSLELILTPDTITRRIANLSELTVRRDDVVAIQETPGLGLIVVPKEKRWQIWVPVQLDDYQGVRAQLETWRTITQHEPRRFAPFILLLATVGWMLGLVAVALRAVEPAWVAGSSFLLAVSLASCLVILWRSPHVPRSFKLFSLLLVPATFGFLYRALSQF